MLKLNAAALAAAVRAKRGTRSMRLVAREIGGPSMSTLSRVERRKPLEIETYLALCDWLAVSPSAFLEEASSVALPETSAITRIELALRADHVLSDDFVDAVMRLIQIFHRHQKGER